MSISKTAAVSHVIIFGLNSVLKLLVRRINIVRRINSSGNIAIYTFWRLGLKLPIHAHFWWVFGAYFPGMTSLIVRAPKRTVLRRKHVIWAIQRKNQCDGSTWTQDREKTKQYNKKSHESVIFPLFGEKPPLGRFDPKVAWWVASAT